MILYYLRRKRFRIKQFFRYFYRGWYWRNYFRSLWTSPRRIIFSTKIWVIGLKRRLGIETLYVPKDVFGRPYPLDHVLSCTGKGWEDILRKCYRLCELYSVDIHQVKEKFGGLRFYVGGAAGFVLDNISYLEDKSYKICENCGKPGKPRTGGWVKTLCDSCEKVEMSFSHELQHLTTDEDYSKFMEEVESGEVARVINKFLTALREALGKKENSNDPHDVN